MLSTLYSLFPLFTIFLPSRKLSYLSKQSLQKILVIIFLFAPLFSNFFYSKNVTKHFYLSKESLQKILVVIFPRSFFPFFFFTFLQFFYRENVRVCPKNRSTDNYFILASSKIRKNFSWISFPLLPSLFSFLRNSSSRSRFRILQKYREQFVERRDCSEGEGKFEKNSRKSIRKMAGKG